MTTTASPLAPGDRPLVSPRVLGTTRALAPGLGIPRRVALVATSAGLLAAGAACSDASPTAPAPQGPPPPTNPTTPRPEPPAPEPPAPVPPAPTPPAPTPPAPTPPAPTPPVPVPGAAVPSNIVGEWTTGPANLSPRDFWTAPHGMFLNRQVSMLTIAADGQYKALNYIYQGFGSCVTQTWQEVQGTVAVDGAIDTVTYDAANPGAWETAGWRPFVVTPTSGRYKAHERCATGILQDFDRPMTADELAHVRRAHVVRLQANTLHPGRIDFVVGYNDVYTSSTGQHWFQRVP